MSNLRLKVLVLLAITIQFGKLFQASTTLLVNSARIRKKAEVGWPSAEGARLEEPRGVGCGLVWGGGSAPSPEFFLVFDLEMVSFGAFWVAFYVL